MIRLAAWVMGIATAFGALDAVGPRAVWAMDPRPMAALEEPAPLVAMTAAEVRQQVRDELAEREVAGELRQEIEGLWSAVPADADVEMVLAAALNSLALIEPRAQALLESMQAHGEANALAALGPDNVWLTSAEAGKFMMRQLRLEYGRWLCRSQYYDEALGMLRDLNPAEVIHPAALLFFRGVAHQRLAERDAGLADVQVLLDRVSDMPARYRELAELIRRDLEPLKGESLDHISRRMDDVRRRLGLGQGGQPTRQVEDEVLAALDRLINDLEQQQKDQQAQSAAAQGSGSSRPNGKPASDSRIMGGKGPGETTPRDIGSRGDWGDLPPKQRQEALQQIGRDFPAHYRDIVQEYFRRLANQGQAGAAPESSD